jgi:UDP-N-acetylglucosamine 2-epimerase (non-hydrolysing)
MVLVYGDVNSTVAVALVCSKLMIPVAHVEAGLRSFDRTMPEEVNRVVTDHLCDLLLTPSADANENLLREGIGEHRIRLVGNVMIDTLTRLLPQARSMLPSDLPPRFALVTMHRPTNVDDPTFLRELLLTLYDIGHQLPVVFPMHPRTRRRAEDVGMHIFSNGNLLVTEPMSYLSFLAFQASATLVITDSGGVQEETTFLGVPCLTVRENTERPITTTMGTNILVGRNIKCLRVHIERILHGGGVHGQVPPLWDGHAAKRVAEIVVSWRPPL